MTLWVCGGDGGCGTKYAVGLTRCPRCHNTAFYEDGDPMAKITRLTGASDKTLPVPDTEDAAAAETAPAPEASADQTEPEQTPAAEPEPVVEGGEESSPGSSSSASTEKPQPTSEPSEPQNPQPAPTTASRSGKARTAKRTARSTAGDRETDTSAADGE